MVDLPLDFPEPILATYGVMLFPEDQQAALARAAQGLMKPLGAYLAAGFDLPREMLATIVSAAASSPKISDLDNRCWGGSATGELVRVLWCLHNEETHRPLVSWNNAIQVAASHAKAIRAKGSRALFAKAKKQFLPVAHLWGAWEMRGRQIGSADRGASIFDDFLCFLSEAETLRQWGQNWRPPRAKSAPLFPDEMWSVPTSWSAPERAPGWLPSASLPGSTFSPEQIASLRTAGRPKKT